MYSFYIDKIVIGERSVKYSRCAAQEVSIHYRDVGLLDTAEELDMENLLSDTAASAYRQNDAGSFAARVSQKHYFAYIVSLSHGA